MKLWSFKTAEKQVLSGVLVTSWYILVNRKEKKFSRKSPPERTARMVEDIFRCKWSLTVFNLLAHGINRPGEMVRSVEGLTTKVLNECLRRNVEFGILERKAYPEVPPRVEYAVTSFGKKFIRVLENLEKLQEEIKGEI